ncbi:MAG: CvpA family protein [Candidatus Delongbacteria bacterium]|nr:CvpA family protein [Candidatus Delongbacteria bacterium]MBN2834532.1 CvpA family protein [Candidatus Delongbacteria bacterium]
MNLLDILILLVLSFFIYTGFKKGFVVQIFRIVGLFLALLLTSKLSVLLSDLIVANDFFKDIDRTLISAVSGIFTFSIIFFVVQLVGKIFNKATNLALLSIPNKIAGALLGGFKGFLILVIVFFVVRYTPAEGFLMNMVADEPPKMEIPDVSIDDIGTTVEDVIENTKETVEGLDLEKAKEIANDIGDKTGDIIEGVREDVEDSDSRSKLGYVIYKASTLLDPVAEDVKNFISNEGNPLLQTLESVN